MWLAGIAGFFILLSMLTGAILDRQVRGQQAHAALLEQQARTLERQARHAARVRETALQLEHQLAWMDATLAQQIRVALILPELALTLPPGLHLQLLRLQDDELLLEGRARSQADIPDLMRGIRSSANLGTPVLDILEGSTEPSGAGHRFRIRSRLAT